MPYTIRKSDGNTVTVVEDEDIDNDTTSIGLIGRKATNYGLVHAENYLHLLEHFAFEIAPENPLVGQLWFDTQNEELKVYNDGVWTKVSDDGGSTAGGLATTYAVGIANPLTSVLAVIAGSEVVMAISPKDVVFSELPTTITIGGIVMDFASRFPNGLTAGTNLATDTDDFVYRGHHEVVDQALYVGGGSPLAAMSFVDLGTKCILFSISDNSVMSAYSKTVIAQGSLPSNITVGGVTIPVSSVFPTGLGAGLTMASGYAIKDYALSTSVSSLSTELTNAIASAFTNLYTWVDNSSAIASEVTDIKAQFQSSTGSTSFSQAVTKLSAMATTSSANATSLTTLKSYFTSASGETTFATAVETFWTEATADISLVGWKLELDVDGYVTGVEAFNGGATHNFFKVRTSNFIIGDNNIDFIPFEVRGGVVYMKNAIIENLTLGTEKFTANSITNIASFYTDYAGYFLWPSGTGETAYGVVGEDIANPAQVSITTGSSSTKVVITIHAIIERGGRMACSIKRTDMTTGNNIYLTDYDDIYPEDGIRSKSFEWIDEMTLPNRTYTYKFVEKRQSFIHTPFIHDFNMLGICYKK